MVPTGQANRASQKERSINSNIVIILTGESHEILKNLKSSCFLNQLDFPYLGILTHSHLSDLNQIWRFFSKDFVLPENKNHDFLHHVPLHQRQAWLTTGDQQVTLERNCTL